VNYDTQRLCKYTSNSIQQINSDSRTGNNNNTHLTAIFHDNLNKLVPEFHHSGLYWSKNDGGGGDNSSYK